MGCFVWIELANFWLIRAFYLSRSLFFSFQFSIVCSLFYNNVDRKQYPNVIYYNFIRIFEQKQYGPSKRTSTIHICSINVFQQMERRVLFFAQSIWQNESNLSDEQRMNLNLNQQFVVCHVSVFDQWPKMAIEFLFASLELNCRPIRASLSPVYVRPSPIQWSTRRWIEILNTATWYFH